MLLEMTGQKTVPNVFINKKHVGGCDNTMQVRKIFVFSVTVMLDIFWGIALSL